MATIYRYSKDTIKGQVWESSLVIDKESIVLHETHERLNPYKIIKDVTKTLTQEEAFLYQEKNKEHLIETYTH